MSKMKNCKICRQQAFFFCILSSVFCILLLAGCDKKAELQTEKQAKPVLSQPDFKKENLKIKAENEQLKSQLETLMGIDKPARISAVSVIGAIELTGRSGIYKKEIKDSNETKDVLIIYLKTIDDMGDVVKAPGAVKVELWNLNNKPADALIGSWQIEPEKLKKSWSGSLMTNYYKLTFDAPPSPTGKKKQALTLKVEFTDYMSGKILKAQRVVK
jgi:hypothetical protein